MKTNKALELQQTFARRIAEVYRETVHFGRSHLEHIERMKQIVWDPSESAKVPYWLRSYLRGYDHALWNSLSAPGWNGTPSALESVSIGPDGRVFTRFSDAWHVESTEYKLTMRAEIRWRHKPERYW